MNHSIHILIADSQEIYREGLKATLLQLPGVAIAGEASNGLELLHMPELSRTDVILLDMRLPLMDGLEASVIIRRRYPGICIIGLTEGLPGPGTGGDLVIQRYLRKEADEEEMKNLLRAALDSLNQKKSNNQRLLKKAINNPKKQLS